MAKRPKDQDLFGRPANSKITETFNQLLQPHMYDHKLSKPISRSQLIRIALDNELSLGDDAFTYDVTLPDPEGCDTKTHINMAQSVQHYLTLAGEVSDLVSLVLGRRHLGVKYSEFKPEKVNLPDYNSKELFLEAISGGVNAGMFSLSEGMLTLRQPYHGVRSQHREVSM